MLGERFGRCTESGRLAWRETSASRCVYPPAITRSRFQSDTVDRIVDLVVPAGDGPLDLPDIRLETLAWVKMLGKPAAEIEAVDLEGKPVKLADYRGKVVVLAFWSEARKSQNTTRTQFVS